MVRRNGGSEAGIAKSSISRNSIRHPSQRQRDVARCCFKRCGAGVLPALSARHPTET
jgi:hypothetical protein